MVCVCDVLLMCAHVQCGLCACVTIYGVCVMCCLRVHMYSVGCVHVCERMHKYCCAFCLFRCLVCACVCVCVRVCCCCCLGVCGGVWGWWGWCVGGGGVFVLSVCAPVCLCACICVCLFV